MVVIIGSGAGGGIIAMELALANIPVTIIEKGSLINMKDAINYYDDSDEGVDLLKTSCVGGSTVVSAGNGVRVLENQLQNMGISISKELSEIEKLLSIHEMDNSHFGKGTKKFMEAATNLNLNPIKMPKFIQDDKCIPCGKCSYGCPQDAKWSSMDFIKIAIENGANFLPNSEVLDISHKNNEVDGVFIKYKENDIEKEKFIPSNLIILSAGAINSAILLQKLNIKAGENLFFDSFVTIGGILKNIGFKKEVQMNSLIKGKNFILAPHYAQSVYNELKKQGAKEEDILSIMVKIPDDNYGKIRDSKIIKNNSIKDVKFIAEGSAVAGAILIEAGVDPNSITSSNLRGAHPGGTAAIGEIVNNDLQTEIKGLFVSDASVLPESPGAPPILTILALSKRLSKYIISKYDHNNKS